MSGRWLSIIGIGEDGLDGLSPAASRLLAQARFVVGGARHLALLPDSGALRMVWPSPFDAGIEAVLARRGEAVCVLASGDPFLYGVGSTLSARIPVEEMVCLPAPSSLSLAAARLGWALQECEIVSLHGRPFERVVPHLRPGARLLVLTWDATTPEKLARCLTGRGFGAARLVLLEALGGPREAISEGRAEDFHRDSVDALNLVAIEIGDTSRAPYIPLTPGLPDDWFESDGQITKREIRALTLSALAPWPGARLWDIGAGSGSVAIEWMLAHPRNRAWAVEARPERAARIASNATALGVPDLEVTLGKAPACLSDLPLPDAVFVGGGGAGVIEAAWTLLPPGRRIVVNAVTLESQGAVAEMQARLGGSLTSIAIGHADPVGRYRAWRQAMPVVQWVAEKP
jgi:precorrin-6Y C5,15-methyltransferase (decarboxylating)